MSKEIQRSVRAAHLLLSQASEEIRSIAEDRGQALPTPGVVGLSPSEIRNFSIFRAIQWHRGGGYGNCLEGEASRQVEKQLGRMSGNLFIPTEVLQRPFGEPALRAMATAPGAKGGYLVGVENLGFVEALRNRSVAMRMGATRISGLKDNATFSRQTGKATVGWQAADGTSITATDQTLGQLSMTPKTAVAITDVSEQLLTQSSPDAEALFMADLAKVIAIDGLDAAVINGVGGAQPIGIKNTTGVTTGQDAASATYAKILAFVQVAGAANAIGARPGFVTNTAGAIALMKVQRFTSTDTPVWEGNALDGQLVGFPAMSSEQLASANLIFGSWDSIVIGEWGVLELALDRGGTRFNTLQVGLRAMWMVDVAIRYPQAFVVSTNLS